MDNDTPGAGVANYDRAVRAIYRRALDQAWLGYGIGRCYGVCCLVCLRLPGHTRHEVLEIRTEVRQHFTPAEPLCGRLGRGASRRGVIKSIVARRWSLRSGRRRASLPLAVPRSCDEGDPQ